MQTKTTATNGKAGTLQPPKPAATEQQLEPKQFPRYPLTGVQELIADMVSDLLISGGTRRNVNMLISATLDHHLRRKLESATTAEIERIREKWFGDWYDDLAAARAKWAELPETKRPEPQTISQRICETALENLEWEFNKFLAEAQPEEVRLMAEILLGWRCDNNWSHQTGEIALARHFEDQLQSNKTYIRVPQQFREDVERYVNALLVIEDRPKAA